jgi:hypothetical protein
MFPIEEVLKLIVRKVLTLLSAVRELKVVSNSIGSRLLGMIRETLLGFEGSVTCQLAGFFMMSISLSHRESLLRSVIYGW